MTIGGVIISCNFGGVAVTGDGFRFVTCERRILGDLPNRDGGLAVNSSSDPPVLEDLSDDLFCDAVDEYFSLFICRCDFDNNCGAL